MKSQLKITVQLAAPAILTCLFMLLASGCGSLDSGRKALGPKHLKNEAALTASQTLTNLALLVAWSTDAGSATKSPLESTTQWLDLPLESPEKHQLGSANVTNKPALDRATLAAVEHVVVLACESAGFHCIVLPNHEGVSVRESLTTNGNAQAFVVLRFHTAVGSTYSASGQALATAVVFAGSDVAMFRGDDLTPLAVADISSLKVVSVDLTGTGRNVAGIDYAAAVAGALSEALDDSLLGVLQSTWQKTDIEAKLASLQTGDSHALPSFTESKSNGKDCLQVVVDRPDSTVIVYAGGSLPRRWTATKGRPVHVLLELGTYPLVIVLHEASQNTIHSGQFTATGGKTYLLEVK